MPLHLLSSALTAYALFAGGCDAGQSFSTTGLRCAEPSVDFGQVWEGEILSHEFVFDALGPTSVTIEAVKADCGCTVAWLRMHEVSSQVPCSNPDS